MAEKIDYRIMQGKPITKTYQGILRISPNWELQQGDSIGSVFLNPTYFGPEDRDYSGDQRGNQSVSSAFGGLATGRYVFHDDKYKNVKVPVTDSMGNYMNFNVGEHDTTVGSDELNNGTDNSTVTFNQVFSTGTNGGTSFIQSKVFPVITSKTTSVGLDSKDLPHNKSISGGVVNIDSSPYNESIKAQLIVNNSYDHTPSNITNGVYKPVSGIQRRTIYRVSDKEPREYDILAHVQDDVDIINFDNGTSIDSYVDILNLKDYVRDKLELWRKNNKTEVPTGTIMWQYINLRKWYCLETETWTGTGNPPNMGHYPPMGKKIDNNSFTPSLYQGVVRKGISRLSAISQDPDPVTGKLKPVEIKEIIPLYKRDYVLCDGSTYYIYLLSDGTENHYDLISYDMFKDLFFAIDYTYTDFDKMNPCKVNELVDGVYKWKKKANEPYAYEEATTEAINDKHYRFTIDLSTMLAFRVLQDEITNGTSCVTDGKYDRAKAEKWLKEQSIPSEYVFNTLIPNTMTYTFTDSAGKTIGAIPVGREVNSFSSLIYYYNHTSKSFENVELWKTAEVQFILDLFNEIPNDIDKFLNKNCIYSFQVPTFTQTTRDYATGLFIGSSPQYWTEDSRKKNITYTESVCDFAGSSTPHRHFMFMGPSTFIGIRQSQDNQYVSPPSDPLVTFSGANPDSKSFVRAENAVCYLTTLPNGNSNSVNVDSYSFAELNGLYYDVGMQGGIPVYTIQMKSANGNSVTYAEHPDPRWRDAEPNRGITSGMVFELPDGTISKQGDEKYFQAQTMTAHGLADYFTPESVCMLPLIKI